MKFVKLTLLDSMTFKVLRDMYVNVEHITHMTEYSNHTEICFVGESDGYCVAESVQAIAAGLS